MELLLLLVERRGNLVAREEIAARLWDKDVFHDIDNGVHTAIRKVRQALNDSPGRPVFVQTVSGRGYRFVAPVERIPLKEDPSPITTELVATDQAAIPAEPGTNPRFRILATPQELPKASYPVVQTLFILLQCMYLGFYIGALANLTEIADLFSPLPRATQALTILIVTAAILIPVRAFVLSAALFHAPGAREKFLRIWPFLLILDELWSLSPFLLLHHINFGLALACMTLLVYSPFAQRSLVLMGAGAPFELPGRR